MRVPDPHGLGTRLVCLVCEQPVIIDPATCAHPILTFNPRGDRRPRCAWCGAPVMPPGRSVARYYPTRTEPDDDELDAAAHCPHCFKIHVCAADDEICAELRAERADDD